jgi:hypothetical protein
LSLVLIRLALPSNLSASQAADNWTTDPARRTSVLLAVNLVPFAGIAFLWFIGVVRDRMGQREDRFFASVFLGSGILFVAMLFAATAMAAGLIATLSDAPTQLVTSDVWRIARAVTYALMTTYSMRMAAVFMTATATITLRIAIMPKWLAYLGYTCALVLLISVGIVAWVELLFPAWVLLVSIAILIASLRTPNEAVEQTPRGPSPP